MNEPETCFESGGEEPRPGSQPWTMEYVARLFIEGGGFQGIADIHNAAFEWAKTETEAHLYPRCIILESRVRKRRRT